MVIVDFSTDYFGGGGEGGKTSSCVSISESLQNNRSCGLITQLPGKKDRPRCYAKSPTVQNTFNQNQASSAALGDWEMGTVIECSITLCSCPSQIKWSLCLSVSKFLALYAS